jgi:hypothetical protein
MHVLCTVCVTSLPQGRLKHTEMLTLDQASEISAYQTLPTPLMPHQAKALNVSAAFCIQIAYVLRATRALPATSSAGEDLKTPAVGMAFALTTENAIATMEEQRIWGGAVEIVRFHAMGDPQRYAHCMAHAIRRESVPACRDSGVLIAA